MQIALDSDRTIVQYGESLGDRAGCTIEEIDEAGATALLDAMVRRQLGGTVLLSVDGAVTVQPPPQAWLDAEAARQAALTQRAADIALLTEQGASHPDPLVQAAARLLAASL